MAGAYVLAHALAHADGDYGAAFASYQRDFKPFIDEKQVAAARFARWFAPRTRLQLTLRNAMMRLLNVPRLGEWLVARSFTDNYALP